MVPVEDGVMDQPAVTSKTGWITLKSARTLDRRVQLQIFSCRLGISIVAAAADFKEAMESSLEFNILLLKAG